MNKGINPLQELPSGVVVEINEWTVGDIAGMGERGKAGNLDQMLARCRVIDDSQQFYGWKDGANIKPEKMIAADRGVLAILQRIVTHYGTCGAQFDFSFSCKDQDCHDLNSRPIPWSVDLRRFLLTKEQIESARPLEEGESLEETSGYILVDGGTAIVCVDRFGIDPIILGTGPGGAVDKTSFLYHANENVVSCWKNGNKFEYTDVVSGQKLWWKLLTGDDEMALTKYRKDLVKLRLAALSRRIVEVEGVDSFKKDTWLSKWGAGAEDRLQKHIGEIEPGLIKDFEISCPRCGLIQEISFPLDLGFFSPSATKKKHGNAW